MSRLTNQQRAGQAQTATGAGTNSFTNGYNRVGAGRPPGAVIPDRIDQNSLSGSSVSSYPSDLPPVHFSIIQAHYQNIYDQGRARLTSRGLIQLPMPLQIPDQHRVIYNDGYSYLGALTNAAGTVTQTQSSTRTQIAGAIGQFLGAGARALGFTVNSFRGVTIEQPQFKNHQFSWKFSPKSEEESFNLQRIIYNLKKSSAIKTAYGVALTFPDIFIPFFSNMNMMYKFKPCVLSSVDVDYVGGNEGPAFFANENEKRHAPESIGLTLSFLEIEYWTNQDFVDDEADGMPSNSITAPWNWNSIDNFVNTGATAAADRENGGENGELNAGASTGSN